jgi:L-amino acid N-acyltransferase YncA
MTAVVVRPATAEDVPAIARIHVAGYEEAYRGLVPDAVIDSRPVSLRERVWTQRLSEDRPREFVFVAELDGDVRGFVSGRQAAEGEVEALDPAVGCWENMYSDPEIVGDARGFKVALEMHRAVDAAFREHGYREAVAFVIEGNDRAGRFFELLGWKRDGGRRETEGLVQHRVRRTFGALQSVGTPMEQQSTMEERP